ncbi:class I SAM-dependent methyltransferase [Winogradskya consettensis]|uniref:SAM-dependent methyltransferase n=1 Tax=Winogradskya consettensis TaxID=113560 RepID=A0A919S8I8_9ACTN|nr:class I SAM-dependent methyltransferase [Actinoplanes consettensis]GIM67736.1 SAM-dependent methyltransferase [Actinoplanes consettensis]
MTTPTACRMCRGTVIEVLDLGPQPSANAFLAPGSADLEMVYRLAAGICESCTLLQLIDDTPPDLRYSDTYRYEASGSAGARRHFAQVAERLLATELTGADPFIVEIGCNDGVLLDHFARAGVRHLGVEPSKGVAELAMAKGVNVTTEFFGTSTAVDIRERFGRADVVFGANTICSITDIADLMRGVDTLLSDDGVFVFEEPYADTIVRKRAFDQIYDEHVFYFSVRSVQEMAHRFGFELVDAEQIQQHGGEIRYTLARPGTRTLSPMVGMLLFREAEAGLADPVALRAWAADVQNTRTRLVALLENIRAEGHRVVGYGAPAKATTMTNFCGIGPDLLPFICDSTPGKQGRLTPGSHIPVRPRDAFAGDYPQYALLFAWNHAAEIMAKEQEFSEQGGKWIVYVPGVRVI